MKTGLHGQRQALAFGLCVFAGQGELGCSPQRYGPPSGPAPEYEPQTLSPWDAGVFVAPAPTLTEEAQASPGEQDQTISKSSEK